MTQSALQATANAPAARRFDLTLDDAVQRALERNLDIAVQRINPLVQDMAVATANSAFLPLATSGFGLNQATRPNRTLFDGGGLGDQSIVNDQGSYDLGVEQRVKWGGGRYKRGLEQQPVGVEQHLHELQPELQREHDPGLHAAAAARLPDGRAAHATGRSEHQPRHLRHRSRADHRQHARQRPPGVLGAGLRTCGGQRAAAGPGAGRAARSRQPRAGRDRHAGPDRRRPGAVGGRRTTAVAGAGHPDPAHQRAGAEAARSRRHFGRTVERGALSDGPAADCGHADRHRGSDSRRARPAHRHLSRAAAARHQRRHREQPPQQHPPRARSDRQLRVDRPGRPAAGAERSLLRSDLRGHGRRDSGRLR